MEPQSGLTVNESTDMVNMYCTFTSNPPELVQNATWYKDGKELFIDETSGHYVSHISGYPILTIFNPNRNDSGSYFCAISNSIGRGMPDVPIQLTVLYPPSVNLQVYPNPKEGFSIKEGDDVRMICDVTDGNPLNISKVKWMKNDAELATTSQSEFVWRNVERSLAGNYSCFAFSHAGWSQRSNSIEIDVNFLPGKAFIKQLNGILATKGENLTLECIVNDLGLPLATDYYWEHDGMSLDMYGSDSILHITNITLKHRGNLTCSAMNQVGFGEKATFQIEPYAAPHIIESLPETSGALFNASEHGVSCRIECYPICNITWMRNGRVIDNSSQFYSIKNSIHPEELEHNRFVSVVSTLIWNMSALAPLNRTHDNFAKYSCVSSENEAGPSVRSDMQFFVECKYFLLLFP